MSESSQIAESSPFWPRAVALYGEEEARRVLIETAERVKATPRRRRGMSLVERVANCKAAPAEPNPEWDGESWTPEALRRWANDPAEPAGTRKWARLELARQTRARGGARRSRPARSTGRTKRRAASKTTQGRGADPPSGPSGPDPDFGRCQPDRHDGLLLDVSEVESAEAESLYRLTLARAHAYLEALLRGGEGGAL